MLYSCLIVSRSLYLIIVSCNLGSFFYCLVYFFMESLCLLIMSVWYIPLIMLYWFILYLGQCDISMLAAGACSPTRWRSDTHDTAVFASSSHLYTSTTHEESGLWVSERIQRDSVGRWLLLYSPFFSLSV